MTLYAKLMELREHQASQQQEQVSEHAPFSGLSEEQAAAVDETAGEVRHG